MFLLVDDEGEIKVNILSDDKTELLTKIAINNNMNLDTVLGIYSVIGNDIFLILDLLEGHTIVIPTKGRKKLNEKSKLNLIEYTDEFSKCQKGDIISYQNKQYNVLEHGRKILGRFYLPVSPLEESDD